MEGLEGPGGGFGGPWRAVGRALGRALGGLDSTPEPRTGTWLMKKCLGKVWGALDYEYDGDNYFNYHHLYYLNYHYQ